eukprot:jgi/Bigna1/88709/estExt_fgenesh1_pg.C_370021
MARTYNKVGGSQSLAHDLTFPSLTIAAADVAKRFSSEEIINIADLGCSQGLNSMRTCGLMIDVIEEEQKKMIEKQEMKTYSEFMIYHEDLPTNDFNQLMDVLSSPRDSYIREGVYACAIGRSFYARLFPPRFLHMVTCYITLHWLSTTPSVLPGIVFNAAENFAQHKERWALQAREDLKTFLQLRADELKAGGHLVAVMIASKDDVQATLSYAHNLQPRRIHALLALSCLL